MTEEKLTVVIQAGGKSSRMGKDKALLPFLGTTLIERVIQRVQPIADEILITTNQQENYQFLNLPLFSDIIPNRGALGGLYTALKAASNPYTAVIACDMPFVNGKMLMAEKQTLISTNADIVIPHTGEGLEPFHSVYRNGTCLPAIKSALSENKWRVDAWFSQVKLVRFTPQQIRQFDPQMRCFFNINTPDDLQKATQLAITYPDL